MNTPSAIRRLSTLFAGAAVCLLVATADADGAHVTLNQTDDGYRDVWYMNQPSGDEYVYNYSGGLGTLLTHGSSSPCTNSCVP